MCKYSLSESATLESNTCTQLLKTRVIAVRRMNYEPSYTTVL